VSGREQVNVAAGRTRCRSAPQLKTQNSKLKTQHYDRSRNHRPPLRFNSKSTVGFQVPVFLLSLFHPRPSASSAVSSPLGVNPCSSALFLRPWLLNRGFRTMKMPVAGQIRSNSVNSSSICGLKLDRKKRIRFGKEMVKSRVEAQASTSPLRRPGFKIKNRALMTHVGTSLISYMRHFSTFIVELKS